MNNYLDKYTLEGSEVDPKAEYLLKYILFSSIKTFSEKHNIEIKSLDFSKIKYDLDKIEYFRNELRGHKEFYNAIMYRFLEDKEQKIAERFQKTFDFVEAIIEIKLENLRIFFGQVQSDEECLEVASSYFDSGGNLYLVITGSFRETANKLLSNTNISNTIEIKETLQAIVDDYTDQIEEILENVYGPDIRLPEHRNTLDLLRTNIIGTLNDEARKYFKNKIDIKLN